MRWLRTNNLKLNPCNMEMLLSGPVPDPGNGVLPVWDGEATPLEIRGLQSGSAFRSSIIVRVTNIICGQISLLPTEAGSLTAPFPGNLRSHHNYSLLRNVPEYITVTCCMWD